MRSDEDLRAVRQYMECFHEEEPKPEKKHRELFHPVTKLIFWLTLMIVISTSDNHLVYTSYAALILLTTADGWLGTALAGGVNCTAPMERGFPLTARQLKTNLPTTVSSGRSWTF